MSLTLDEIYDRNQCLNALIKIEVMRKNTNGTYESSWSDIETLVNHSVIMSDTITSISYGIPNDSYNFGVVEVPSCTLKFNSLWGEFQKETDTRSIFYGFIRHESLVKISFGYYDTKSGDIAYEEVYRGFINDKSSQTKVDQENIHQFLQVEDLLTYLMNKYTFEDISPTEVNLDDLVYEIFNRSEFTDFMTVSTGNIAPGYNVQNISYTDLESNPTWYGNEKILTMLADLSTGHSFFYQRAGVFYYQPLSPSAISLKTFQSDKIVKYMNYERGIDKVYDILYWKDSNTKWEASTIKYNKTLELDIKGINNYSQRVAYLTAVGQRVSKEYDGFILEVPLYPKVFILDKITVVAGGYDPADAFILDKSYLDIDYLREYLGANQTDETVAWMVKEVNHNFSSMITTITVQSF